MKNPRAANGGRGNRWRWFLRRLLHEADGGSRAGAFGRFLDGAKLGFVAGKIFAEDAPDASGVAGADDDAAEQFALSAVGKNINEVQRELFDIVMNHHQIAVEALQLFFVGLDLHLSELLLLLVHGNLL